MSTRDDIAAAANTVPGIAVKPYYVQTTKPGTGFVQFQRSSRDDTGFGFMDTFAVVVVLNQDIATAEKAIESKFDALVAAISEELVVQTVQPITLVFDQASVSALSVEGVRAH